MVLHNPSWIANKSQIFRYSQILYLTPTLSWHVLNILRIKCIKYRVYKAHKRTKKTPKRSKADVIGCSPTLVTTGVRDQNHLPSSQPHQCRIVRPNLATSHAMAAMHFWSLHHSKNGDVSECLRISQGGSFSSNFKFLMYLLYLVVTVALSQPGST